MGTPCVDFLDMFSNDTNNPQEATLKAGEDALLCLCNESVKFDLDSLRYERYSEKVKKCSKAVEAKNLPPISAAARYHSMSIILFTSEWGERRKTNWRNQMGVEIILHRSSR